MNKITFFMIMLMARAALLYFGMKIINRCFKRGSFNKIIEQILLPLALIVPLYIPSRTNIYYNIPREHVDPDFATKLFKALKELIMPDNLIAAIIITVTIILLAIKLFNSIKTLFKQPEVKPITDSRIAENFKRVILSFSAIGIKYKLCDTSKSETISWLNGYLSFSEQQLKELSDEEMQIVLFYKCYFSFASGPCVLILLRFLCIVSWYNIFLKKIFINYMIEFYLSWDFYTFRTNNMRHDPEKRKIFISLLKRGLLNPYMPAVLEKQALSYRLEQLEDYNYEVLKPTRQHLFRLLAIIILSFSVMSIPLIYVTIYTHITISEQSSEGEKERMTELLKIAEKEYNQATHLLEKSAISLKDLYQAENKMLIAQINLYRNSAEFKSELRQAEEKLISNYEQFVTFKRNEFKQGIASDIQVEKVTLALLRCKIEYQEMSDNEREQLIKEYNDKLNSLWEQLCLRYRKGYFYGDPFEELSEEFVKLKIRKKIY